MRFFSWSRIRAMQRVFLLENSFFLAEERQSGSCAVCVFLCRRKKLQQRVCRKIAAAGFLYSIKRKNLIYTAGSGEIFINLF